MLFVNLVPNLLAVQRIAFFWGECQYLVCGQNDSPFNVTAMNGKSHALRLLYVASVKMGTFVQSVRKLKNVNRGRCQFMQDIKI